MKKEQPIFRRVDKFINGELCELFFINDKEVEAKTYYSLLDNTIENVHKYDTTVDLPKRGIPCDKNTVYFIDDKPTSSKSRLRNDAIEEKHLNYCENILEQAYDMDFDEAVYFLMEELALQYQIGYHYGQLEITIAYETAMNNNSKIITKELNSLYKEFKINE